MKRLKNMGRPQKAVLNLILTAVFLFALWAHFNYPLPTAELEFWRAERSNLREPSEIVWRLDREYDPISGAMAQLADIFVGEWADEAVAGYVRDRGIESTYLEVWPLGDGPSPVPLTYPVAKKHESGYLHTGNAMLFLRVPEEAAVAQIQVWADQISEEKAEGQVMGNGVVYFWFPPVEDENISGSRALVDASYTLWLYDKAGTLLLEQEGTIPRI